jgi:hypothetical protein
VTVTPRVFADRVDYAFYRQLLRGAYDAEIAAEVPA